MHARCKSILYLLAASWLAGSVASGDSYYIPGPDNYANTILSQNPYVYWRLNETIGTTAADATGNGRTATYTSGPVLGNAGPQSPAYLGLTAPNYAPSFDGATDDRVLSTLNGLGTGAYSVSFWVNNTRAISPAPSGLTGYLFSRGDTTSDTTNDNLGISGTYPNGNGGRLVLYNGGTFNQNVVGPTTMTPGTWYHVALTRSGTTVAGYVNGNLEFSSTTFNQPWSSANPLITLGTRADLFADLLGQLDEVAVFNRALTQGEIQAQYTSAFSAYIPALTPEPSSIALFALVGIAMAAVAWRRRAMLAGLEASS